MIGGAGWWLGIICKVSESVLGLEFVCLTLFEWDRMEFCAGGMGLVLSF